MPNILQRLSIDAPPDLCANSPPPEKVFEQWWTGHPVAGDDTGYTIIEADDLPTAKALTDGLPFLSGSDGRCAVEIFELLPKQEEP